MFVQDPLFHLVMSNSGILFVHIQHEMYVFKCSCKKAWKSMCSFGAYHITYCDKMFINKHSNKSIYIGIFFIFVP